jgi:hypothetical protein
MHLLYQRGDEEFAVPQIRTHKEELVQLQHAVYRKKDRELRGTSNGLGSACIEMYVKYRLEVLPSYTACETRSCGWGMGSLSCPGFR